jgi:hypothetical protein
MAQAPVRAMALVRVQVPAPVEAQKTAQVPAQALVTTAATAEQAVT